MELYSERNPYADHLVEVNKHNPVETVTDICNELGATIVPKGTQLTEDVANKLSRFKLLQPLELQVSLSHTLSPVNLSNDIRAFCEGAAAALCSEDFERALAEQCSGLSIFPLVNQKLTVFSERLPEHYHLTQGVAMFAMLLATELGLNADARQIVFLASQMHEAGLLNIPPELCETRYTLEDAERRQLDSAQLQLGKKFLDQVPNLSRRVGRAVMEHRERCDGSGWPRGLTGDPHSIETQVLALAVFLNEALEMKLRPRGYDLPHLLPWVQSEHLVFEPQLYSAIARVLKQSGQSLYGTVAHQQIPALAQYLRILQFTMKHWLELAASFSSEMQEAHANENDFTVRSTRIVSGLESLCFSSGIWDSHIEEWLAGIDEASSHQEFNEVELTALMLESLLIKFKRLHWALLESARCLGKDWLNRCERLGALLYRLPEDHCAALQHYGIAAPD